MKSSSDGTGGGFLFFMNSDAFLEVGTPTQKVIHSSDVMLGELSGVGVISYKKIKKGRQGYLLQDSPACLFSNIRKLMIFY